MVTQMFVTSRHDNVMINVHYLIIQNQQPNMEAEDSSVKFYDFEKVKKEKKTNEFRPKQF